MLACCSVYLAGATVARRIMNGGIGDHLLINVHEIDVEGLLGDDADSVIETALERLLASNTTSHNSFSSSI
jgi:hypothetical protein